jgi:RND superfamily putative drug exporter
VPFREFAFAMCVGVLIDSFLVRALLVPSLMTLFGRFSHWPGMPKASLPEPTPRDPAEERAAAASVPLDPGQRSSIDTKR